MSLTEFYTKLKDGNGNGGAFYYKLSFWRCSLYGMIVAWGMFQSGTEGFDSFSDMTGFQQVKLFGNMLFSGFGGVMLAFLDQTLSRLAAAKDKPNEKANP